VNLEKDVTPQNSKNLSNKVKKGVAKLPKNRISLMERNQKKVAQQQQQQQQQQRNITKSKRTVAETNSNVKGKTRKSLKKQEVYNLQ